MAKKCNPFKELANFYKEGVAKADKRGFAGLYKKATEILFDRIRKETGRDLHFEDIKYEDGYFIFGHGTNSVVKFHIKEAPGWLGGIWWQPRATEETKDKESKERKYRRDSLTGSLFFQFEEEIDKFKPSASMFGGNDFDFYFKDGCYDSRFWDTCKDLEFIIDEPYLAFYKEMTFADFNHKYVSRDSAKRFWDRHWKQKAEQKKTEQINTVTFMNMVKYVVKPAVEDGDVFIMDRGDYHISPKYEIFMKNIKLDDGFPAVSKPGCYGLFNFEYPDKASDEKLWGSTVEECEKRASKKNDLFIAPCDSVAMVLNPVKYNKVLKESIKDGTAVYYAIKKKGSVEIIDALPVEGE